jgi:alkylhydroperoxidase family enzyme
MARIEPLEHATATPDQRATLDEITARWGRATNMKRTLARSPVALRALMEWYPLRDAVEPVLGERLTAIFCHAISAQSDCLICGSYFRRELIEAGENPDELRLDEREQAVVDFGRQLMVDSNGVSDELLDRLAAFLSPEQIIDLAAFGAMMVATNVFNNALHVPLDEYLFAYRRADEPRAGTAPDVAAPAEVVPHG